ncbi:outer membrane protein assembly factor BamD [Thermodesulforhabdus norvegica]|uniref:Beta-barrel assembly machine subunit BamD n=1 Tax=Thermodesulforhabdus norvegica TaxID=39841 RepID=A0A1I4SR37_9BACT|nr:outer membrane protein assembly factor BamD [Thermodesulforhabdus norvegica]SFM66837.1 Beta-barrel assembly machine subunit BamD [Thermodesulforhabdus norvegica]
MRGMDIKRRALFEIVCVLFCVLLVGGCGTNLMEFYFGDLFESGSEIGATPDQLVWKGLQSIQDKDYGDAQKAFEQIIQQYPYSKYVVLAELKLADAYYLDEKYEEAAAAYEQFARLHPGNPVVPYVLYQLGMCYANMARSIDRDHGQLRRALTVFERITQAYAGTVWAQKARDKAVECRKKLAEYELYVARFYMKRGEYRAAAGRLEYALSEYLSEMNEMGKVKEAQEMLARCREEIDKGFDRPSLWTKLGF